MAVLAFFLLNILPAFAAPNFEAGRGEAEAASFDMSPPTSPDHEKAARSISSNPSPTTEAAEVRRFPVLWFLVGFLLLGFLSLLWYQFNA